MEGPLATTSMLTLRLSLDTKLLYGFTTPAADQAGCPQAQGRLPV